MSEIAAATPDTPKAKAIAAGAEVWCQFEELVPTAELKPNPRNPNQHPSDVASLGNPAYCDVIVKRWLPLGEGRGVGRNGEDVSDSFASQES